MKTLAKELLNRAEKYNRSATIYGEFQYIESAQYYSGMNEIMNNVLEMVEDPKHTLEMIIAKITGTLPMMEKQIVACANHNNRTSMQYYCGNRDASNEILKLINDMQPAN